MKRHIWGPSKRPDTDEYRRHYESCVNCDAERFKGRWHQLRRPDRHGISRKWRAPGRIHNSGSYCTEVQKP